MITFQGECREVKLIPMYIELGSDRYRFAGSVLGNTYHAIAIVSVPDDDFVFLKCDDRSIDTCARPNTR